MGSDVFSRGLKLRLYKLTFGYLALNIFDKNQQEMKTILKLEELAMTAIAIYFLTMYDLGLSTWLWILLFFAPDIGMLGYLIDTKVGAISYNLFHHKGIAIVLAMLGYYLHNDILTATGILLFAHASFDRIMGYGLKYVDSFKHTHLGSLEKK